MTQSHWQDRGPTLGGTSLIDKWLLRDFVNKKNFFWGTFGPKEDGIEIDGYFAVSDPIEIVNVTRLPHIA